MARNVKTKNGQGVKSGRRRTDIRRTQGPAGSRAELRALLTRAELLKGLMVFLLLLAATALLVNWSREQVLVRDGQVMTETQLKRLDYQVLDQQATEEKRREARQAAPRMYRINESHRRRLEAALLGLPRAVAGKTTMEEISEELVQEFQLTEEGLWALQEFVEDGEPVPEWEQWVSRLLTEEMIRRPLISSQEHGVYTTTLNRELLTRDGDLIPLVGQPIQLQTDARAEMASRLRELVRAAGFPRQVDRFVTARLTWEAQPLIVHDSEETERIRRQRVDAVEPVYVEHERGEVLYRRGDVLSASQYEEALAEAAAFRARAPWPERWLPRLGTIGLLAGLLGFLGLQVARTYPRVLRRSLRITALALLMATMLGLTVVIAVNAPNLLFPAAIAPTLFVAVVAMLAYDARLALLLGLAQSVLVTLALGAGVGWLILLIAGCSTILVQLRDMRHRNALIRAATVTALALGFGVVVLGVYEMPAVAGAVPEVLWNTLWSMAGAFAVGFLVLGILPSIERLFDITTGMTLAELRDPKQPLLRQLQQKAPGTYNHSLQVANIAEAAADAIGADSLLVYVGALYHDIGKMNKPEYFVENQTGGANRHDKLSPAMSLLVIIGHVKDGIEMARDYNLPRPIQHFIESHHGTTLVEYFYHAARSQAKAAEKSDVTEFEFRYPGPKPQTREAAIMMIADAVESATRAMAEPNPARIETLVREISRKRLMDGQFNQCDLTFRELGLIEDAVISRLCSIYHGRITYPSARLPQQQPEAAPPPAGAAGSEGPEEREERIRPMSA